MPPALYYYVNFHTIKLNKSIHTNTKSYGRPLLRDIEWEFFYNYSEARGFSGFKDDDKYSCHRILLNTEATDDYLAKYYPDTMDSLGNRKTYVPARKYMRQIHSFQSSPLFQNEIKNFMMLGSRGFGKSFSVSGLIAHNFLFDGATEYSEDKILNPDAAEILVGAAKSDRSADILKKVKDAFDFLPGKQTINNRTHPSPFSKRFSGSWSVNATIAAEYKRKTEGQWTTVGSRSNIKHRSFNSDAFAAQGTRPILLVLEEIGMFPNLKEVHANTVDNLTDGYRKTGMAMMLGTGGDMEQGTLDASEMFYEPDKYDILSFENDWESSGPIGYFVPAYLALNQFKDLDGNTDIAAAKKEIDSVRRKKRGNSGSSDALNKEMQYRPIVPSEMFLTKTANIFPAAEIRRRLSEVQSFDLYNQVEKKVNLYFDPKSQFNGVSYNINESLNAISTFPYKGDDREGAVVIYELPKFIEDKVPSDAYIIGCDPFKDDTHTGESLAAIYVMKTSKYISSIGYDEIVASYVGRPYFGKNEVNETLYKLSLFYGGAKIYFENAVGNVKDYFEKIRRLDLLARQPVTVFNKKASYESSPQVIYGYPMSNDKVKWEAIQYLRSWLLQEREENKRNLDLIIDPGLLQELLAFNMSINTDRVMSLVGCIIGLEEINNISKRKQEFLSEDSALQKDINRLIINNKRLFQDVKFPKTTSVLF